MIGEGINVRGVCGEEFSAPGTLHGMPAGLWLLLEHRVACPVSGGFDRAVGAAHAEDGGDLGPGGSVGFGGADDAGAFEVEGVPEHLNLAPLTDDDLLRIADRPGGINDQLRAAMDARDHTDRSTT